MAILAKPAACRGCPLYGDGKGFVPDEVVEEAEVFVLGQNPGREEEREGRPFVGATGRLMVERYFPAAERERGVNVSIGNALRCRFEHTNELPPDKPLKVAVLHCQAAHFKPPSQTRLVVAQGRVAWLARGQETSVTTWRGFLAPEGAI